MSIDENTTTDERGAWELDSPIWIIVGVLAIIALLIYVIPHLK